jgi:hypothetical protein
MTINDTLRLQVIGRVHNQDHVHDLHFRVISNIATPEQGLIDAWQAGCRTQYRAIFYTQDSPCVRYSAQHICGSGALRATVEETELAGSILGTRADLADPMDAPAWLAEIVSVRTALAGRSRRGRFYLGGLDRDDIAAEVLGGARQALTATYVGTLMNVFGPVGTNGDFTWVVHSRKLATPGTACTVSSAPVTGTILRANIGSQRSRYPGSGT